MRAVVDRKYKFFIVGLHRTGTTILTCVLDSLDNGVCWGEPHWHAHINSVDGYDFFEDTACDYDVCGYKETYKFPEDERPFCDDLIERHIPVVDFFIVTFRNPLKAHSSMRNWVMDYVTPEVFLDGYRTLDELSKHEKGVSVVLEDFIDGGLDYLNGRLPFSIEGDIVIEPERSRQKMGDSHAVLRSDKLEHRKRTVNLNREEVARHAEAKTIWKRHRIKT